MVELDEETRNRLAKVDKVIRVANGFRMFFLTLALLLVLFLFWGRKAWEQAGWFITFMGYSYFILGWLVVLMIVCIMIKIIFAAIHNTIVKKL